MIQEKTKSQDEQDPEKSMSNCNVSTKGYMNIVEENAEGATLTRKTSQSKGNIKFG